MRSKKTSSSPKYSRPSTVWYEGQEKESFEQVLAQHIDNVVLDQLEKILLRKKDELYRELLSSTDPYKTQYVLGQLQTIEYSKDLFKWRHEPK